MMHQKGKRSVPDPFVYRMHCLNRKGSLEPLVVRSGVVAALATTVASDFDNCSSIPDSAFANFSSITASRRVRLRKAIEIETSGVDIGAG